MRIKLYTEVVEFCGMCPASVVRRECVVGPSHLHCKRADRETKPESLPEWCPLEDHEDPDGYVDGERKF